LTANWRNAIFSRYSQTRINRGVNAMADIIPLTTKARLSDAQKAEIDRQRKIRFIQKILRLPHTTANCEKCGSKINPEGGIFKRQLRVPYYFCSDCSEEYIAYIEQLKGHGNPDDYWHNGSWQKIWRAWIDYQNTIDQFLKTKEFQKLLKEIKPK